VRRSIYDQEFERLGHFDFALCLGFLHRVPNPFGAIETLTRMSDVILLEWKAFPLESSEQPLLLYDGQRSLADDPHSRAYFCPSISCVGRILADHGFSHQLAVDDGARRRAILVAATRDLPLFRGTRSPARPGRLARLYRYTRWYAARVREVLSHPVG
jgi:hypothetical protein